MIGFLSARAIAGLEVVARNSYSRTIEFENATGSIHVSHAPQHSSLSVTVRFPRLDVLPRIIARIRRQFDLGAEPNAIAAALASDSVLAPLVAARPGLRVPGGWDGFEIAVRAVLGQQITVKGATRIASRIVGTLGREVTEEVDYDGLTHVFPRPERFNSKALTGLGMTKARASFLAGMADATRADTQLFDPRRDLAESVTRLRQLSGIGEWTANYIAMRALGESDAFLASDVALQRSAAKYIRCSTPQKLLERAERWRPWRAYAMLYLWMADTDAATSLSKKEACGALTA